ncbi:DUF835 domain-containing protein [Thermococcus sp. M36]|uniref:DUF835 domain-containing protein n=1 Tax=Thermococcus sp. M36 TaxID=1638261 RepID=UPI00143BD670|nr:DUF835 domain-containing protein [Thermococcus sp. M36]NJE05842.1 DUF835 domain-containing protein [Thermococcus sp. M36]
MAMNHSLLLAGQALSSVAKLVVMVFLIRAYLKSKRSSALTWAVAWLGALLSVVSDAVGNLHLIAATEAVFASMLFLGALQFLSEELGKDVKYQAIWASPPLVTALYGAVLGRDWESIVGIPYGVSAFFVVLSGTMILMSVGRGFRDARNTAITLLVYGLHKMDYPFLRDVPWFAPVGFTVGAVLTVLSAYFMVRMVLSEEFIGHITLPKKEVLPGVKLIGLEEYQKVKRDLRGYPVLAFTREHGLPPGWKWYLLTNIEGENTISPTNLPKILSLSQRYLLESETLGITGVVVLDCVEYLIVHNGMTSVLKFMATLRDLVVLKGGTFIVVLDEGTLNRREYITIRRVLTGD